MFEVRRQIGKELIVVFEVTGVSARDLVSSYSSRVLAIVFGRRFIGVTGYRVRRHIGMTTCWFAGHIGARLVRS